MCEFQHLTDLLICQRLLTKFSQLLIYFGNKKHLELILTNIIAISNQEKINHIESNRKLFYVYLAIKKVTLCVSTFNERFIIT